MSSLSRTKRGDNQVLVSGMIDKDTEDISDLYSNFTQLELEPGGLYDIFLETGTNPALNMHPNLRDIVNELENAGKSLYNVDNISNLDFAGHNIAAHAEVRALDSLIKKKFGNNVVSEEIFNDWIQNSVLGYNRNIVTKPGNDKFIMPCCADCFYITDLVTFIN